jgi:hypothetical protein
LAIFKTRLPSKGAVFSTLVACVFLVQVWSIVAVLRAVPAWILYMNIGELIGTFAYTQAFALIESLLVLAGLLLLAFILPGKLFRDRFVAQGSLAVFLTAIWAIISHVYGQDLGIWANRRFLIWAALLIFVIVVASGFVYRFKGLQHGLETIVERLTVLSTLYMVVDVLSILIVLFRIL